MRAKSWKTVGPAAEMGKVEIEYFLVTIAAPLSKLRTAILLKRYNNAAINCIDDQDRNSKRTCRSHANR